MLSPVFIPTPNLPTINLRFTRHNRTAEAVDKNEHVQSEDDEERELEERDMMRVIVEEESPDKLEEEGTLFSINLPTDGCILGR
jgi:hypothetical protein